MYDAANKETFLAQHLMIVPDEAFGDNDQYVSFFHPEYGRLDSSSSIPTQVQATFLSIERWSSPTNASSMTDN